MFLWLVSAVCCFGDSRFGVSSSLAFVPASGQVTIRGGAAAFLPGKKQQTTTQLATETQVPPPEKKTRFQRYAERVFDESDVNHDGYVSFEEAYALVLKLYVNLNRQAPIPPPPRDKVYRQYKKADKSRNDQLDKEEFSQLVKVVAKRALWRVSAVKICRIVGAPVLAELVIRTFAGKEWLPKLAKLIVPNSVHDTIIPVLTSTAFWRPVLLIALVISMGKVVLNIVNFFLDICIPDHDADNIE